MEYKEYVQGNNGAFHVHAGYFDGWNNTVTSVFQVNWMKHTVPTASNKGKIIKFFKDTAAYRQMMLKKGIDLTITDFITTFPRAQDMPELVS